MQSCFRDPQDPRGRSRAGRHDRVVVVMVELLSTCWCNPPHRSPNLSTMGSISANITKPPYDMRLNSIHAAFTCCFILFIPPANPSSSPSADIHSKRRQTLQRIKSRVFVTLTRSGLMRRLSPRANT